MLKSTSQKNYSRNLIICCNVTLLLLFSFLSGFCTNSILSDTQDQSDLPKASEKITTNASGLSSALNNVTEGNHIILLDGVYSGFTITKGGSADNPVVIRAENMHQAVIKGNIIISADYVWVYGLHFDATAIIIKGNYCRVARNIFDKGPGGIDVTVLVERAGYNFNRIDHNELKNIKGRGICVHYGGIAGKGTLIDRNLLRDFVPQDGITNAIEGVQLGGWRLDNDDYERQVIAEYNLFVNVSVDDEIISVKSGYNIIRHNTFKDCVGSFPCNRHSNNNFWLYNYISGSMGIHVLGERNHFIGNVSDRNFRIFAMGGHEDQWSNGYRTDYYPAAHNAKFIGNKAPAFRVGELWGNNEGPVENVEFMENIGKIVLLNNEKNTLQKPGDSEEYKNAFELTVQDAGPFHPEELRLKWWVGQDVVESFAP